MFVAIWSALLLFFGGIYALMQTALVGRPNWSSRMPWSNSDFPPPPPDQGQHPAQDPIQANPSTVAADCFPGLGFKMPDNVPNTTEGWWCDYADEYAFVGFSYEVTACECSPRLPQNCAHPSSGQSLARLTREFKDIRTRFNGRYVRLYGAWCVGDPRLNEAR